MKKEILLIAIVSMFLFSCSTTMQYTWVKENYQGKSYENILWIGTLNQGLFKYNLNTGEFTQYNKNTESHKR